jgi:hypothetical protein
MIDRLAHAVERDWLRVTPGATITDGLRICTVAGSA